MLYKVFLSSWGGLGGLGQPKNPSFFGGGDPDRICIKCAQASVCCAHELFLLEEIRGVSMCTRTCSCAHEGGREGGRGGGEGAVVLKAFNFF